MTVSLKRLFRWTRKAWMFAAIEYRWDHQSGSGRDEVNFMVSKGLSNLKKDLQMLSMRFENWDFFSLPYTRMCVRICNTFSWKTDVKANMSRSVQVLKLRNVCGHTNPERNLIRSRNNGYHVWMLKDFIKPKKKTLHQKFCGYNHYGHQSISKN